MKETTKAQLLAVEAKLREAVLQRDRKKANELLDPDYIAVGHQGLVVDRDRYLDIHFAPERDFTRFETEGHELRLLSPDVALLVGHVLMWNAAAARHPGPARFTAVYRRAAEDWRIAAWQETPIEGETP